MATRNVHVVAKANAAEHQVKSSSTANLPKLADGHVRIKSLLVGLTSNNMSYATNGTVAHWWDTFPVPSDLPAPYNDQSLYGVVPCWGYGEVLESKIESIRAGRLIWGFWPSSDLPIDMRLKPAGVEGHYIEISEHRSQVWNLYNRYVLADASLDASSLKDEATLHRLARTANAGAVWEAGYLLNKAIFGSPPIHPLGDGEWSPETGDLSSAVVISLSGSGRTARSFTDNIFYERPSGSGPLALLAVTSNAKANIFRQPPIPTHVVPYTDVAAESTFTWIRKQHPEKIVVVDFGGRDNAFDALFGSLEKSFPDLTVMAIGVGGEAKVPSAEDVDKFGRRYDLPNWTMMNATALRDAMMARSGEAEHFRDVDKVWQGSLQRGSVDDLKLDVGEGISGERGFEKGWADLCVGGLPVDGAKVYVL